MKQVLQHLSRWRYFLVAILLLQVLPINMLSASVEDEDGRSIKEAFTTLKFDNEEVVVAFDKIEEATGFGFSYNINDVKGKRVSGQFTNKSLFDILVSFSHQLDLTFRQYNDMINVKIRKHGQKVKDVEIGKVALTVHGTVTDKVNGEPLPGVNVLVKNTNIGTVTDMYGNYNIPVPDENDILIFSFIGYISQEVPVNGRTEINVTMAADVVSLDEVVVVGYGTQREKDLTGSVSQLTSDEFNTGQYLSPQQLVQGKMAGVSISQNSGKPGGSNTVLIRGGTSVTGSNEPLYVIDGVPISTSSSRRQNNLKQPFFDMEPVNPLNALNPNDIESITVLKDASATAIYGSRGANGVIVITTKSGSAGPLETTYNARFGVSSVANKIDVLDADEYRKMNQDLGHDFIDEGANTDWQDEIFRTAISQAHYLSFGGGTENSKYRGSIGYSLQEGVIAPSQTEDINARLNTSHNALDGKLKVDLKLTVAQMKAQNAQTSNVAEGEGGTNVLLSAYRYNPTLPVYNKDGTFNQMSIFSINPVSFGEQMEDETNTRRMLANVSTTYQILDPLSINVNLGYTHQDIGRNAYISKENPLGEGEGGWATTQSAADFTNLMETTLRYNKSLGGDHKIDAIAGYSYQYFVDEGYRMSATGFISDAIKWNSIQAASFKEDVRTFKTSNTLISYYGRLNYIYGDKYLVTATVRRDGSSRFGAGNKWGLFPSGSVAWRISQEDFFPDNTISDLKLRVSYGVTGNQEIGNLNAISTLGASSRGYVIGGKRYTIVLPEQYMNPDLKWEETSQLNIGTDFELLKGRVYGKFDVYKKTTNDLLLRFPVPSPSVVSSQLANVGSVENKGFEFQLGSRIIQKNNLVWKVDVNGTVNKNEVISLSDNIWSTDFISHASAMMTSVNLQRIMPGYPVGTFYGPEFLGLDEDGFEILSEEDKVIGNARPDLLFGFSNSLFYNNWDLNFTFRGSVGNDVVNLTAFKLAYKNALPADNVLASAMDDGVNRDAPLNYSSRWIEDGSFVRLDNLSLGYNFNLENSAIKSARLFINGQNLFLITGYSGLDPEVNSDVTKSGNAPLGVDFLSYPRARTFTIGANISF